MIKSILSHIRAIFYYLQLYVVLCRGGFKDIKIYKFSSWHLGFCYFEAQFNGEKVFIKCDCIFHFLQNEQIAYDKLSPDISDHLVKIVSSKLHGKFQYIAYEFINSESLLSVTDIFKLECRVRELFFIVKTIRDAGIIHRDVKLDNFLVANETIKVIDFTFAHSVDMKHLEPSKYAHCMIAHNLGHTTQPKRYMWDDFYALVKLIDGGVLSKNQQTDVMQMIRVELESHIGKSTCSFSARSKMFKFRLRLGECLRSRCRTGMKL